MASASLIYVTAQVIAQSLGLEVTEHSYEDSWLMADTAGCGYHLRNAAATFDVATVQRQCDISFEYLWKQLRVFQGLKLDMSGRLGFSGFIEATELDDGPYARNLFCFLDVNQSSHVTFIEFVQRLSVIRNKRAYHHRRVLYS